MATVVAAGLAVREGRRCLWRPGGAWRGGRWLSGETKRAKRKAKFRIDNLADINELRRTGGKQWEAASTLTTTEESPLFPSVSGATLSGSHVTLPGNLFGNVSLVSVFMRAYGMQHCQQYSRPFKDSFGRHPATAVFELSLVDMWIYRLMVRLMAHNLTKTVPPSDHGHFMLYSGRDVPEVRKTLQLGNSVVGYVFLLDTEGRVRWRAHATPTQLEIETLLRCSGQLLNHLV